MKAIYGGIGVVWVFSLLAGHVSQGMTKSFAIAATSAEITVRPSSVFPGVINAPPVEGGDSRDAHVDIRGNEVERALADYRIDLSGGIYERHSPETAVVRLGSPSS